MEANLGDYPSMLHGPSSGPKYFADEINKYGGSMPDSQACRKATEIARPVGWHQVNIGHDLRWPDRGIRKVFADKPAEFDSAQIHGPGPHGMSKTSSATRSKTSSAAPVTRSINSNHQLPSPGRGSRGAFFVPNVPIEAGPGTTSVQIFSRGRSRKRSGL